jgi:hypothetical protein
MLISALVGMAITATMAARLDELVQHPKAPNLYWALTDLPRPFIGLRKAMQSERVMFTGTFRGLRHLRNEPMSTAELQPALDELAKFFIMAEGKGAEWQMKLLFAAMAAKAHPEAKQFLLAQGTPAEKVEAMPVMQVALLYMTHEYNRFFDDMAKWAGLPYGEARAGLRQTQKRLDELVKADRRIEVVLAGLLLPAVDKVNSASARTDRKLAALRCVEAIRLHAKAHGRLPEKLADVTAVPVPADPVTGRAFEYQAAGDRATLIGPDPDGDKGLGLVYELTLQR